VSLQVKEYTSMLTEHSNPRLRDFGKRLPSCFVQIFAARFVLRIAFSLLAATAAAAASESDFSLKYLDGGFHEVSQ
jgi:hypothetical protein